MSDALAQALQQVFLDPHIWGIVLLAACYGVFIGATPGLTATMATALLIPLTYWLSPVAALAAIVTMVACAIFAGDIPTTLVRIPGTPASAAYVDDVYELTKRGESDRALGVALCFSVMGGLFGAVVLMFLGSQLARVATGVGMAEYFWLYLLGLSCAVLVSRRSKARALLALFIGLLLSTMGLSKVHTAARFTFNRPELYQGINFIPAMIGLFGVSEVLRNLLALDEPHYKATAPTDSARESWWRKLIVRPLASVFAPAWQLMRRRKLAATRSASIGAAMGMLPGAGADIAAWVSLAASKQQAKQDEPEEDRALGGVADATTANSSALAGAWIPALVFGIPGDSVTAIVLGVLLMKNVKPGPQIFIDQAVLVYSIYLIFILANLILLPIGFLAIKAGGFLVRVPRRVLLPIILLFCVLGSYAINSSYFDVGVMLAMGIMGFVLERCRVPLGPVVLGIILGAPLEERLIQVLTASGGSPLGFFARPGAAILGCVCIGLWLLPMFLSWWRSHGGRPVEP